MKTVYSKLLLAMLTLLSACGADFDPASRVNELRVLAVQADHPFALPGQEVKLNALAYDPEQRPLSWGWGLCFDDSSSLALDCLRALTFESLTIAQNAPTHTVRVPSDVQYMGVVLVVCPGTITRGDTFGVPVACVDAQGRTLAPEEFELGLKRIYVRDPALNRNPELTEVLWDGASWPEGEVKETACEKRKDGACEEWTKHDLILRAPDAAESSVDRDGKPGDEQAVVQLYATGGTFEDDLRVASKAETTWHARDEDAGMLLQLWFVVRDDRGGVSWVTRSVRVP